MAYEPFVGYGTRKGVIYELDTYGIPNAPDEDPYVGSEIYGIRGLQMQQTNVRRIAHYDGDRVALTQIFPTLDVPSGTITIDGVNPALDAICGNVLNSTVSGIELTPHMSDQQGNEPFVGLMVYQAATDNANSQGWHVQFIPYTQIVPVSGSFGENNYETTYQLSPSASSKHLWGMALATLTDGTLSASLIDGFAPGNPPRITAWRGDGSTAEFLFNTSLQPSVNTYSVYQSIAGTVTAVSAGLTKSTTKLAFATGSIPADETVLIAIHDVA